MKLSDYAAVIRRSVTARQVAELLGLAPNRAGFCKCPMHGEKTGSLKLYPGDRGWYCFGCHQGGSVIDLVMQYYGMDLKNAIQLINEEFGLGLPIGNRPTKEQEEAAKRLAAEREAERKRREKKRKEQNKAFLRWCDLGKDIAEMEMDRKEFAPGEADEEWDPRFIRALREADEKREEAERMAVTCFGKDGE